MFTFCSADYIKHLPEDAEDTEDADGTIPNLIRQNKIVTAKLLCDLIVFQIIVRIFCIFSGIEVGYYCCSPFK